MPINTGMSVQVSLPNSVEIYLRQWLKVVSGDRVYLAQYTSGLSHNMAVFKCRTCGDNWHVGDENFEGTSIPSVLKDWVYKHRHVCSKFNPVVAQPSLCQSCSWPYGAHEESWSQPKIETDVLDKTGEVIPGMKWVTVKGSKACETLPEFTGRVFRD